ncbi:PolB [Drosophila-associated adintovirus 3]|uniref:PolB n=1 Tax=Drosophila-associated adintovirus 3 TaxID=2744818 RepID=A0A7D4VG09_9VIRU|nr:PolB [Drosophila-associated adintovirus 3]
MDCNLSLIENMVERRQKDEMRERKNVVFCPQCSRKFYDEREGWNKFKKVRAAGGDIKYVKKTCRQLMDEHLERGCKDARKKCQYPAQGYNRMNMTVKETCKDFVPFSVYYDFETILETVYDNSNSPTSKIQNHKPSIVSMGRACHVNSDYSQPPVVYSSPEPAKVVEALIKYLYETLAFMDCAAWFNMSLTDKERKEYRALHPIDDNTLCHICGSHEEKEFYEETADFYETKVDLAQEALKELDQKQVTIRGECEEELNHIFNEYKSLFTTSKTQLKEYIANGTFKGKTMPSGQPMEDVAKAWITKGGRVRVHMVNTTEEVITFRTMVHKDSIFGANKFVLDHDHFKTENRIRGWAHNECNLHYHFKNANIPVIAHNAKKYDVKFVMSYIKHIKETPFEMYREGLNKVLEFYKDKNENYYNLLHLVDVIDAGEGDKDGSVAGGEIHKALTKTFSGRFQITHKKEPGSYKVAFTNDYHTSMSTIAQSSETMLTLKIGPFQFLDSIAYIAGSLESIVKSYDESIFHFTKYIRDNSPFPLVDKNQIGKLKMPFSSFTCFDKLLTTDLPYTDRNEAYRKVQLGKKISDEDIDFFETSFKKARVSNLVFMEEYCRQDVAMLMDWFEQFREETHQELGLDPLHRITLPGFSWLAWKNMMKGKEIHLVHSPDLDQMYRVFGGISCVNAYYRDVNNKYAPGFDSSRPSNFIEYVDANNLYGDAMRRKLPVRNFRFLTEEEIRTFNVFDHPDEGDHHYQIRFVVDREIPPYVQRENNDYPLIVSHTATPDTYLSPMNKETKSGLPAKTAKLVGLFDPDLIGEHELDFRLYKKIVEAGYPTKIKAVVKSEQEALIKDYVDMCTSNKAKAKTESLKNLWKLLVNAIYGKTVENIENRSRFEIADDTVKNKSLISYIDKGTVKNHQRVNPDLSIVSIRSRSYKYSSPRHLGATILNLSKLIMIEHLQYLRTMYGKENVDLLATDTDSLIIDIKTDDFFNDILTKYVVLQDGTKSFLKDKFDFCKYKTIAHNSEYADKINKIVGTFDKAHENALGRIKDELKGNIDTTFYGVRSKCYYIRYINPITGEVGDKGACKGLQGSLFGRDNKKNQAEDEGVVAEREMAEVIFTHAGLLENLDKGTPRGWNISEEILSGLVDKELKGDYSVKLNKFESRKMEMFTVTTTKRILSRYNDKRWDSPCGTRSRPIGYYFTQLENEIMIGSEKMQEKLREKRVLRKTFIVMLKDKE